MERPCGPLFCVSGTLIRAMTTERRVRENGVFAVGEKEQSGWLGRGGSALRNKRWSNVEPGGVAWRFSYSQSRYVGQLEWQHHRCCSVATSVATFRRSPSGRKSPTGLDSGSAPERIRTSDLRFRSRGLGGHIGSSKPKSVPRGANTAPENRSSRACSGPATSGRKHPVYQRALAFGGRSVRSNAAQTTAEPLVRASCARVSQAKRALPPVCCLHPKAKPPRVKLAETVWTGRTPCVNRCRILQSF